MQARAPTPGGDEEVQRVILQGCRAGRRFRSLSFVWCSLQHNIVPSQRFSKFTANCINKHLITVRTSKEYKTHRRQFAPILSKEQKIKAWLGQQSAWQPWDNSIPTLSWNFLFKNAYFYCMCAFIMRESVCLYVCMCAIWVQLPMEAKRGHQISRNWGY